MLKLEIDKIVVENRFRKNVGDLDPLMRSIESLGLLQPIGVTSENVLVYGERRLRACTKLGWKELPVVLVDCHPLKAERDENTERRDFTVEEKLLLAEAISKGLGDRKGSNQYKNKLDTDNCTEADYKHELGVDNCPQADYKEEKTRDIAARESGIGSSATLRRAKTVMESGDEEVIKQMNSGEITINKAHTLIKGRTLKESVPLEGTPPQKLNITICIEIEGYKIELTKEEWKDYIKVIRKELTQI